MLLSFTLGMPNVGSWNGKWTGESRLYVKVIDFGRSKAALSAAITILEKSYYYYNFGDGWGASVTVKEVDAKKARQLRAKSAGFCGYEWMIKSICDYGDIRIVEKEKICDQK
jgi:hypothetical protein